MSHSILNDTLDLASNRLYGESQYLVAADVSNTANLYGWHMSGASGAASLVNWIGSKDLTVAAGALTSQVNFLNNTVYCGFDGATYLSRGADATFNMNSSFSLEFWAYHSAWSSISTTVMPISCVPGSFATGWYVGFDGNGFHLWTPPSSVGYGGLLSTLPAGWHHFAISRTSGGNTYFYINGKWSGTVVSTVFTGGGNLEIGAGGGGGSKFTGRIGEVSIDTANAWTEAQVRKIYARGARRFAALDPNGAIQIPQNELIEYPIRKLVFSSTPAGWTPAYAFGRPSKDALGNWYFEFWLRASWTTPITNGNFSINGITAKNCGQDQACVAYSVGGSIVSYCEVGNNSNVFPFGFSGATTYSSIMVYGKIMLENAPTM